MYNFSLLKVGYTFHSQNDVNSFLKAYGQYNRFAIIKKRVEQRDDGIIRHQTFGCEFGGKFTPKKSVDINVHHNQ